MSFVNILDQKHETSNQDVLNIFKDIPFELDDFQKHGIERIYNNENILVTAATGSGKTLMGEYAILKSFRNKKKCIYTSPIKSLSNQKFADFKRKFKGISIGILTGDIKFNPDADVIIMTTEILRNLLYKKMYDSNEIDYKLDIDINLKTDVDCIVFDEVHYLNDDDRGHVWEETLVLLPKHINLVLLSATINNGYEICKWLGDIKQKPINLIPKQERIIPLTHYLFYTSRFPKNKSLSLTKKINKYSNKLVEVMNKDNVFNEQNLRHILNARQVDREIKNHYDNNKVVVNNLIKFLESKKLLPCLFFVFSRKQCEILADATEVCLTTLQEQGEIQAILNYYIHRLDNKEVYLNNPEFHKITSLLMKGVCVHHSGILNVLKEIIEILYTKGLIKVLFATETFAVGVNAPVKTVVFTDLKKYSNDGVRFLKTSEYLQMSGRAGRRGIDKVGNVILLANLIRFPKENSIQTIKKIMTGKKENITSKFNLSYKFLLKMLLNEEYNYSAFLNNTFMSKTDDVEKQYKLERINKLKEEVDKLNLKIKTEIFDRYYELKNMSKLSKKQKNRMNKIAKTENFETEYQTYVENYHLYDELNYLHYSIDKINDDTDFVSMIKYLFENKYINTTDYKKISNKNVSKKGILASQINECNEILLSEMIINNFFNGLNIAEIVGLLSVFAQTKSLDDENRVNSVKSIDVSDKLKDKIQSLINMRDVFRINEEKHQLFVNTDWELNLDMVECAYKWVLGYNFNDLYYDNWQGTFIKDMLKIDNLICTCEVLFSIVDNKKVVTKLMDSHEKILRDIVSSESLYLKI
jgi:antiviral helicase SKI2